MRRLNWARLKIGKRDVASGFTIVELLIVIVVIGILVAIVIVAYSGIQQRAHDATVRADMANSAKKMENDNALTGGYSLSQAGVDGGKGLPASSGTTYVYHSTGTTYCITGTNGSSSYTISDTTPTPAAGGCPGDGVGGIAAVTNLITNPSFEGGGSGWGTYGTSTNYTISGAQAYKGSSSMLMTEPSDGGYHGFQIGFAASAGNSYALSTYTYRVSGSSNIVLRVEWYTSASAFIGYNQISTGTATGSWTRQSFTATAPASTGKAVLVVAYQGATNGESFYADGVMATQGSSVSGYADGTTSSWIWTAAPNSSTSTGPPQ